MNKKTNHKIISGIIFAIALLFYLFFSLYQIHLPGTEDDEVLNALCTFALLGKGPGFSETLNIGNLSLPLMQPPYKACGEAYFLFPFFKIFGLNVVGLRTAAVFYGFLTLIALFFILKKYINNKIIVSSIILLLGTHPTFILSARVGTLFGFLRLPSALFAAHFLYQWHKKEKNIFLLVGVIFLGIGFSIHPSFIYLIFSFVVTIFLYFINNKIKIKLRLGLIISFVIAVLLGNILFLLGNIKTGFPTVRCFVENIQETSHGIENSNYFENLKRRKHDFLDLLDASSLQYFETWDNDYQPDDSDYSLIINRNYWYLFLFVFSFILIFYDIKNYKNTKGWFYLVIMIFLFMAVSPFTLRGFSSDQIIAIFPFLIILSGYLFHRVSIGKFKTKYLIICLLLIPPVIINFNILTSYHKFVSETGGIKRRTDAIYRLADWIKEEKMKDIVTCDWGLHINTIFNLKGLYNLNWFWHDSTSPIPDNEKNTFLELFKNERNIYAFRNNSPNIAIVTGFANSISEDLVLIKRFYQRNGTCVFKVFKLQA